MHPPRITSEILDRIPPNNLDAEKGILGSVLLNHEILDDIRPIVQASDFYADAHAKMFAAMLSIASERGSVDTLTLATTLKAAGHWEAVGGAAYLAEVVHSVATYHHAPQYAEIVAGHARRRAVIHATTEILRDAYDVGSEPGELVARGQRILAGIEPSGGKGEPETIGQAAVRAMTAIDAAFETREKPGTLTGLYGFDDRFGGLASGELVILAGRPGDGKTSIAMQIANHVATRGRRVYFASLEMSNVELATRLICSLGQVSNRSIRAATLTEADRKALVNGANMLPREKLITHDRARLSVYEIAHAARKVARDGIGLVVVDYLQRITPANRMVKRHEQIGEMSDGLKALARELECPVLCLCQLSRAAETESEPRLSHLRESGSIEADADVVFFIRTHPKHDGWWEKDGERWNAELIIGKGRNMGRGKLRMIWEPTFTRFRCLDDPLPHDEFTEFSGGMGDGF
jgi:replicative DNA helicase